MWLSRYSPTYLSALLPDMIRRTHSEKGILLLIVSSLLIVNLLLHLLLFLEDWQRCLEEEKQFGSGGHLGIEQEDEGLGGGVVTQLLHPGSPVAPVSFWLVTSVCFATTAKLFS